MSKTEEIDSEFTEEVVCPHCGEIFSDSWEFDNEGETECPECEKEFNYRREVEVTYTSWKKENLS